MTEPTYQPAAEPAEPDDAGCGDDTDAVLAADTSGDDDEPQADDVDVGPDEDT